MQKREKKILAYLLIGSLYCTGCESNMNIRKEINTTSINTQNEDIFIYSNENLDNNRKKEKNFEKGTHIIVMKIAGTLNYDNWNQIIIPEGYEICNLTYGENATGEFGYNYGYFVITLENIVPVKATGYLDIETENYYYLEPGTPIKKEEQKLERTFSPYSKN